MIAYLIGVPVIIVALGLIFFYRTTPSGFQLTPKKLAHGVYAGLVTLFVFLVAGTMLVGSLLRKPDMKSLVVQANELISHAGGPREICDEADRLFKTFRSSDDGKTIDASDVAAYPAIVDLLRANVHGHAARVLLYGPPVPRVYFHVGGHIDGYTIEIVGTGASGKKDSEGISGVNLANSCIFIEQQ